MDDSGFQSRPSPLSRRHKYSAHIETVLSTVAGTVAGTVRGTVRHTVAGTAGMKKPARGGLAVQSCKIKLCQNMLSCTSAGMYS